MIRELLIYASFLYPFLSLLREFDINFCVILMTHSSGQLVCGLPNLDLVLIFSTRTGLIT